MNMGRNDGSIQSSKSQALLSAAQSGGLQPGVIDEWMWRRIIEKMYDQADAQELEERFVNQINMREEQCN